MKNFQKFHENDGNKVEMEKKRKGWFQATVKNEFGDQDHYDLEEK